MVLLVGWDDIHDEFGPVWDWPSTVRELASALKRYVTMKEEVKPPARIVKLTIPIERWVEASSTLRIAWLCIFPKVTKSGLATAKCTRISSHPIARGHQSPFASASRPRRHCRRFGCTSRASMYVMVDKTAGACIPCVDRATSWPLQCIATKPQSKNRAKAPFSQSN